MSEKTTVHWHDLLAPLNPAPSDSFEQEEAFRIGRDRHRQIEAMVGKTVLTEQERVYVDPDLPFEITYHPDVLHEEMGLDGSVMRWVYEIKPLIWFMNHRSFCEAQLTGYKAFTGAVDGSFLLYWGPDDSHLSLSLYPSTGLWDWASLKHSLLTPRPWAP